jgi:hypothetical protein
VKKAAAGGNRRRTASPSPLTLLLVEGDTEIVFYQHIKSKCLAGVRVTIENLEGNRNVDLKVLDKLTHKYAGQCLRAYCCLDRETRYGGLTLDLEWIRRELRQKCHRHVLSIDAVIATQMIESWFFHDIDGIYRFLGAPKSKRKPKKYAPPERFRKEHLKDLFEVHDKTYYEGEHARSLIEALDVRRIAARCADLRDAIALIKKHAADLTNHLHGE